MSALPPIRRKHRICVICEGYEDYHYFNRLIALNLWDASYSFTTINVKSASNIPARFQNEYQNDRYEIILVFCDTDKEPYREYTLIKDKINSFLGKRKASDKLVIFANPCTMQIVLLHFGDVSLKNQGKKTNSAEIERLTGIPGYDAHEEQIQALCGKITRASYTTTNYYDRMQYKASVTATGAIAAGRLGVFNSAGKLILLSTAAFDVTKPILYIGTAYATGKLTQTDNYISWGTEFSLENTVSGFSGTAGATVYIRGTLNGNMFTPASGVLTTTAPITEDGYTYILLGLMSTTTAAVLAPEHPMFRYYNGGFKTISQISYEAFLTAEEAQEAIDALAVGGHNYILNSGSEVATSTAQIARYALSEPMIAGEQYTVSLTLTPMEEYAGLTVRTSEGSTTLATIGLSGTERQTVRATFIAEYAQGKSPDDAPDNADILIYRKPASAGTATTIIHQIKLEK